MFNSAAVVSVMKVAMMMLMILGMGVEAAPPERGFMKHPHPPPSLTHDSAGPQRSVGPKPSEYLRHWLLSAKAAGVDGTGRITDRTAGSGTMNEDIRAERVRNNPETSRRDKRAQMLKMISALEELQRVFNSTLSSRITIIPRAHGRNPGRKNKALPAVEGGVRPTTATPAVDSTASRASADVIIPSLTGRNFKKSLPSQNKKTNKRVCFWKYCSQN